MTPEPPADPGLGPADPRAVYEALDASINIKDRRIDLLGAAGQHVALRELSGALAVLRITPDARPQGWWLSTAEAHFDPVAGRATLTGQGSFGLPGAEQANVVAIGAELVYPATGGAGRFGLTLNLPRQGWTFGTTFATLPPTETTTEAGPVELAPSFLAGLNLTSPALAATSAAGEEATLALSGWLPLAPALGDYADFFGPWPLLVDGNVKLPESITSPPELDLVAHSGRGPLSLGPAELHGFGLALLSETGLDSKQSPVPALSTLVAVATLALGSTQPVTGEVSTDLLAADTVWRLTVNFDRDTTRLDRGLAGIAALFGIPETQFSLPPGLDVLAGFAFTEMEISLYPPTASGPAAIDYLAVTLQSTSPWRPPVPMLQVSDLGMRWLVAWSGTQVEYVTGTFFGSLVVGPDDKPDFVLDITAFFPQFGITAVLASGAIPIDKALRYFFGTDGPDAELAITGLELAGNPRAQTLSGAAGLTSSYRLKLADRVEIELTGVYLRVDVQQGAVTGGIRGTFTFVGAAPDGLPDPRFYLGAEYTGSKGADGWVFTGGLYPDSVVELVSLITKFAGMDAPPPWAPTLTLERLTLRFATKSKAYAISGTVVGRWKFELAGTQLPLSASASVDVERKGPAEKVNARLAGEITVNKISVLAVANLTAGSPTYELTVDFGGLWVSAVTGWRGTGEGRHQVISFQVGGVTLGDLIEYLVRLAAPTLGFKLEPPWDLLNRIELSRFTVTVDPSKEERSVELIYQAGAELLAMKVDTIGLRYKPVRGRPSVQLILTGDFLGTEYGDEKPLSWDVVSGSPPAVPGQGKQLLDIRYLGIGQRVTFRGELPSTVRESVDRLRNAMPPAKPDQNPLRGDAKAGLRFAADSQWLIGLDATLAGTLSLGAVFNDPRLYGLSVGLSGEKAGGLAGLSFEILYKKISDDVGVFRAELRVPDAFRRVQLGAVAVTLGVLVVEVYTNGNFLVDLGFPHNRDFARSFTVEVTPFIGRGGIYFGVADSTTSRRVPAITNGTFAPVVTLGIGLAIGVGKEISAGPLSGGAYVEVIGIFEGVFGWFNPSSAGLAPELYYWVQAYVAIHGKVYGSIDLKIIQVTVTIEAWAQATVILEAYRAALLRLSASVRVSASVKIIFFRVSFEFSASIDLAFVIGTDQATPWILATGQGGASAARLRASALPPLLSRPDRQAELLTTAHLAAAGTAALDWDPHRKVFPDSPRTACLTLLPVFSVTNVPVSWGSPAGPGSTDYRVAFCLLAPDGGSPVTPGAARPPRSAELSTAAATPAELAASLVIEALLRWSISAVTGSPGTDPGATVTAGQLRLLAGQLELAATADTAFSAASLAEFFRTNLQLQIAGDPGKLPDEINGTAVPVPPFLSWVSPQAGDANFATRNMVGPLYTWGASRYAARFSPSSPPGAPEPPDDPAHYHSMASYVFGDWTLMVAKTAVTAAADTLAAWPFQITRPTSLADVAGQFPSATVRYVVRAGDTLDSAAAELGASPAELGFLNPELAHQLATAAAGAVLPVRLGVSPEAVAQSCARARPAVPSIGIGAIDYPVRKDDTLDGIAGRFHLPDAAALFAGAGPPLADDAKLLRARARLNIPGVTQPWPGTALLAAATFFSRYHPYAEVPEAERDAQAPWYAQAAWYAQAVFDLNRGRIEGGPDTVIPAGTELSVPAAQYETATEPYLTVAGDTLNFIGLALALAHNYGSGRDGPDGWPAFRDAVRPGEGGMLIPPAHTAVLPGETVTGLGLRTIAYASGLAALLGWLGSQPALAPLSVIRVPDVTLTVAEDDSLASLAVRAGLSLTDLATRIAGTPGVLSGTDENPLTATITGLPVQHIGRLVDTVLAGSTPLDISGRSARQLMSGLRLPSPEEEDGHVAATGPLSPLYDLTGQMAPSPVPDPNQPDQTALEVVFSVNPGTDWITFADSAVTEPGDTVESLRARYPDFDRLNPALAKDPGMLRPGLIFLTALTGELNFEYTNQQLTGNYPATALTVEPYRGPAALPVAETVPVSYGLDQRITVQAPTPLPVPREGGPPLAGAVTAWPLPDTLLAQARAGSGTPYDVCGPDGDLVTDTTFGTLFSFGVHRLDDQAHVYELIGADTAGRDLALKLWRYLADPVNRPGTVAYLGVTPSPDAADTAGLALLDASPDATFLVRTNLSTQSVPPTALALADQPHYAPLADLSAFCLLLWEGSVVGGAGYYLGFGTPAGGDLPAGAFDEHGVTRLRMLVIAGKQRDLAPQGRTLLPVSTCVLAAPTLDPATASLLARAADGSETTLEPSMPPGTAGFSLTVPNPGEGTDPQTRLHRLFSLLSYAIPARGDSPFVLPPSGLPAGPAEDDGQDLPLWLREQRAQWRRAGRAVAAEAEPVYWRYQQALPVSRYAPKSAPAVAGLPDPGADPYRGIRGESVPVAGIQLGFADVLGNVTAPPGDGPGGTAGRWGTGPGQVAAEVGYTDALLGAAAWPAVTLSYGIARSEGQARLTVTVAPQPAATAPAPGASGESASESARRQAERYALAYYQTLSGRVTASVLTSLHQDADGQPSPLPTDGEPLWRFAAAGYTAACAAAAALPVTAGGRLAEITADYGVSLDEIATVSHGRHLTAIFGDHRPAVPAYAVFAEGASAKAIVDGIAGGDHPGWPHPATGAALLKLPRNADVLPLRPGTMLVTPGRQIRVLPGNPPPTLASLAALAGTEPGQLASDNQGNPDILQPGFVFEADGVQVTVPDLPYSLDDAQREFARLGIPAMAATIAAEVADRPGMFAEGAVLTSCHYVARADDTLEDNDSGFAGAALAELNGPTADIYDAGALVYLGTFDPDIAKPEKEETLGGFAARFGCPPGLLLAANSGTVLPEGAVVIPGAVRLPEGAAAPRVPYSPVATDALDDVAARFASRADRLAAANASLPATLAPGKDIEVTIDGDTSTTTTRAGDSFADVHARLAGQDDRITLSDMISAIAGRTGFLAAGSLLICPPAVLPGERGQVITPAHAEDAYHVGVVPFAQANAGTIGLIAPGVTLADPLGKVPVTTGANDTFNTIASRFARAGAAIDIADIVTANRKTAFLRSGAAALLPPAPARVTVSLGTELGRFSSPVFPLSVVLRLTRPGALVDPHFRTQDGSGPAERADSTCPAPATAQGRGDAATLTLAQFAADFTVAFPALRLGTARTGGAGAAPPDVWVTDFRDVGIAKVHVKPGVIMPDEDLEPRYFALRPLYNNLVTRLGVEVRELRPDGSLSPETTPTDFQGVDVEVWARRLLADVDLFLTAAYAARIYADPAARTALGQVLDAKGLLAQAVPRGLATVLDVEDPGADDGLADAVTALRQETAISLSRAYDVATVIQYDAEVESPWTRGADLRPARLFGTPQPSAGGESQPYTLTAAKTALDQAKSHVSFLMRVPDPAHHGRISIANDYVLLDLEFDIQPVDGAGEYEDSRWLAFYPPLAGEAKPPAVRTDLGTAIVPVPLRAYPAPPVILGQAAVPTAPAQPPPSLADARLWTYALTYAHEHAEQDEVLVAAAFNVAPRLQAGTPPPEDVVTALAKYVTVAPALWGMLAHYAGAQGIDPAAAARAAGVFAGLVQKVAERWNAHWPPGLADGERATATGGEARATAPAGHEGAPASHRYDFRVRVGYKEDPEGNVLLDTATLTYASDGVVPPQAWPQISCQVAGAPPVDLHAEEPDGRVRVYRVPTADRIPAGEPPAFTLRWPGLPVAEFQNARAELSVRRNQRLLGPDEPATREAFVYQTPLTQAPAPVAPLLSWPDPVDITEMGADLTTALQAAFTVLSEPSPGLPATVGVRYGHPLATGAGSAQTLSAYVPVAMAPSLDLDDAAPGRIAEVISAWTRDNTPNVVSGRSWAFSVAIYSQIDAAARQPLLAIDRMVYRISG